MFRHVLANWLWNVWSSEFDYCGYKIEVPVQRVVSLEVMADTDPSLPVSSVTTRASLNLLLETWSEQSLRIRWHFTKILVNHFRPRQADTSPEGERCWERHVKSLKSPSNCEVRCCRKNRQSPERNWAPCSYLSQVPWGIMRNYDIYQTQRWSCLGSRSMSCDWWSWSSSCKPEYGQRLIIRLSLK